MNKENMLHDQGHPLKNNDNAFVQVGRDGEPVFPKNKDKEVLKEADSDHQNENINGRIDNTDNPDFSNEKQRPDISKIDRQEGSMNHGELGGNMEA